MNLSIGRIAWPSADAITNKHIEFMPRTAKIYTCVLVELQGNYLLQDQINIQIFYRLQVKYHIHVLTILMKLKKQGCQVITIHKH